MSAYIERLLPDTSVSRTSLALKASITVKNMRFPSPHQGKPVRKHDRNFFAAFGEWLFLWCCSVHSYEQINGLNLFALVGVEEFYPAIDHRADLDFPHWVILVVGPLTFINNYAHLIIGRWFTGIFVSLYNMGKDFISSGILYYGRVLHK